MMFRTSSEPDTNWIKIMDHTIPFSASLYIVIQVIIPEGGAVKYEVDTGVRPALQQAGAFGESTGSKNEGSLGESMIFGIQWEKNTKICGVIGWEPKVFSILDCKITKVKYIVFFSNASFSNHGALSDRLNEKIWVFGSELMQL